MQFSLFCESAEVVEYFFYATPFQVKPGQAHPLLARVVLTKDQFCFGNYWNWTVRLPQQWSDNCLGYLIRICRNDPNSDEGESSLIFDPWTRESIGGEDWGKSFIFQINPHDFSLQKIVRTEKNFRNGPRRLPVLRRTISLQQHTPRPNHPLETSIIYECHVRGMTKNSAAPLSDPRFAGTYRGLVDLIPYFQQLGITALELLPIYDFDETENWKQSPISGERLFNYWGYSPLLFFAPKQNYAFDTLNPVQEFKMMVEAFHQANLEIILDVVYNHTGELDAQGPIDHFKWLGEHVWYLHDVENELLNHSGCGNTLNCSHSVVKQIILSSLYYWVHQMGVDGFRFDLTTILNRDVTGELKSFPSLLWEIRNDPALEGIKFIAEPWDAGGGHQLGQLALHAQWAEWNDRYRNSIRRALRGEQGMTAELKNCLSASPHIYHTTKKGRWFTINYITAHDGATMRDLVSYEEKHNYINGENNQDGSSENYSNNCGVEGETTDPVILTLRSKKIRTYHLLLQLSAGIPMMLAGDELGRTLHGNNNAYCQDNASNWIPWEFLEKSRPLLAFVQKAIAFRKKNFAFLFSEQSQYKWFNCQGTNVDLRHHIRTLALQITHPSFPQEILFMMLNCYEESIAFRFPGNHHWRCLFDTALEDQSCFPHSFEQQVQLEGFSMRVFEKIA